MYIIGGLLVILGDTDMFKLVFFIGVILGMLDNLTWEKTQKGDLK